MLYHLNNINYSLLSVEAVMVGYHAVQMFDKETLWCMKHTQNFDEQDFDESVLECMLAK